MIKNTVELFAMPNHEILGEKIAKKLKLPLSKVHKITFADGEVLPSASVTVRNKDVYVIASASKPVNESLMTLMLFIDSLRRASAHSINLVLTYYGYARQDRKASGRQPIGAAMVADLLQAVGVTKVIAVDLHNPSIQGFFRIPLDDLRGQFIIADHIRSKAKLRKFTVVSPDHGGAVRARVLAELIADSVEIAIVDKRRTGPNKAEVMGILGNVKDDNVIIVDDMIDTGGTIIKAAETLKKNGAKRVTIAATHGIFSKGFEQFENSTAIDEVIITDSIPTVYEFEKYKKLCIISLDDILAKTIKASIESKSISKIYSDIKKRVKNTPKIAAKIRAEKASKTRLMNIKKLKNK